MSASKDDTYFNGNGNKHYGRINLNGNCRRASQCVFCRNARVNHPGDTCGLCVSDRRMIERIDPSKPTKANPGSYEKLLVLCARARARLPLFHPLDGMDNCSVA